MEYQKILSKVVACEMLFKSADLKIMEKYKHELALVEVIKETLLSGQKSQDLNVLFTCYLLMDILLFQNASLSKIIKPALIDLHHVLRDAVCSCYGAIRKFYTSTTYIFISTHTVKSFFVKFCDSVMGSVSQFSQIMQLPKSLNYFFIENLQKEFSFQQIMLMIVSCREFSKANNDFFCYKTLCSLVLIFLEIDLSKTTWLGAYQSDFITIKKAVLILYFDFFQLMMQTPSSLTVFNEQLAPVNEERVDSVAESLRACVFCGREVTFSNTSSQSCTGCGNYACKACISQVTSTKKLCRYCKCETTLQTAL